MHSSLDVANWMLSYFDNKRTLYQDDAAYKIKKEFGPEFVYNNANGNLAISREVLKEFRKLSEGIVVWEKSERAWRKLRDNEAYNGRQVE